jgi:hypothetical protein
MGVYGMKTAQQYTDQVYKMVKKYTIPKRIWPSVYPDLRAYIETIFELAILDTKHEAEKEKDEQPKSV